MTETKTQLPPLSPKMQERVNNKKLLFVTADIGLFNGALPIGPKAFPLTALVKTAKGDEAMLDINLPYICFHGTADEFAAFAHNQIDRMVSSIKSNNVVLLGPDHVDLPPGVLVREQLLVHFTHGLSMWRDDFDLEEVPATELVRETITTVPLDQEKTKP